LIVKGIGSIAVLALLLFAHVVEAKSPWQGIAEAKLTTPVKEIRPGSSFFVGFLLRPEPGYHTYWRGPGVVGVATQLHWDLPEGFVAGDILWPPPRKTDMAGIIANGYKREVILLTQIRVPETLSEDDVTLRVKAAWMACSASCHPSVDNFSLTLPVASENPKDPDPKWEKRFQEIRESLPKPPPEEWEFNVAAPGANHIFLEATIPELSQNTTEEPVFFCDDMQVDSDSPARFEWVEKPQGKFRIHFVRPDFAPENPEKFSGVLKHPKGWKKIASSCVEVSVPWPASDSPDE
jgi:thiol:disulfide interchange protein DsbD